MVARFQRLIGGVFRDGEGLPLLSANPTRAERNPRWLGEGGRSRHRCCGGLRSDLPVVGGSPGGHFVRPTVLTLADTRPAVWRAEVFGPVLAAVTATDAEHALALVYLTD
ncbi:aldehyde dehydrogenase family protein [Saccharopolyspora shandongensis]|uniref:aldehyde dehydrogenase family protein n=1 Tax=Saccharopolyspora shandongensis TaxID=418495 RepID=UPI0033F1E07B